MLTKR
jgi:hypothetical protein